MTEWTADDIVRVIEESGYLMEQHVATRLESLGYVVQTNWAFQDQDEGKSRELDVKAFRLRVKDKHNDVYLCVELLCECKNSSTPLVFLGRRKTGRDKHHVPNEYVFPFKYFEKQEVSTNPRTRKIWSDPPWRHWALSKAHYFYDADTKAVQFCRICHTDKRPTATHGGLFGALVHPLLKALNRRIEAAHKLNENNQTRITTLIFPLVVTRSPLFYIDSQSHTPSPQRVTHVSLFRQIDSKSIKGEFLIDFVHEDELSDFIRGKVEPFIDEVARHMTEHPEMFRDNELSPEQWDGQVREE